MRHTVVRVSGQLAVPMGFTLTVSAVIVASLARWPAPDLLTAWLFCAGAIAAHALIVVALRALPRTPPAPAEGTLFVNVIPLAAIPLASGLSEWIDDPLVGYPVSGALAVLTYIGGLGLYLMLARLLHPSTHNDKGLRP